MGARVAVTGGSGRLGRAVLAELIEHGWDVVNLDQRAPATGGLPVAGIRDSVRPPRH